MKSVYFNSRFWDSSSVLKMNSNEILTYIYLITNDKIKPSGIFKFFMPDCSSRTRLKEKEIKTALSKLRELKVVYVFESLVFVTKFLHETFNLDKKDLSRTIKKSIEIQFIEDRIPIELIACFHSFYNTLSIPYQYPIDTILDLRLEILDRRLEIKERKDPPKPPLKNKSQKLKDELEEIFNYWNSLEITIHRNPEDFESVIIARLKNYSKEEIIESIKNYAEILVSGEYWWTHKYTLSAFLKLKTNNMDQFATKNDPWGGFRKNGKNQRDSEEYDGPVKQLSGCTSQLPPGA